MDSHELNNDTEVIDEAADTSRTRRIPRKARAIIALAILAIAGSLAWWLSSGEEPTPVQPVSLAPVAAKERTVPEPDFKPKTYGVPARLKIPKLGIDAPVISVGVTRSGVMESPKGHADTGWYKHGAVPGDKGSAVIAGHSGYRSGPAVFDDLEKLKPGDTIYVVDEAGTTVPFQVRESRLYKPTDSPAEVFIADEGRHLNLITCTGGWDARTGTHTKRLVVFSDAAN